MSGNQPAGPVVQAGPVGRILARLHLVKSTVYSSGPFLHLGRVEINVVSYSLQQDLTIFLLCSGATAGLGAEIWQAGCTSAENPLVRENDLPRARV